MATYSPQELLSHWQRGQLTVEQVIGQLLQHLVDVDKQLRALKRHLPKPPAKKQD
jgi:hypothetical protein